MKLRIFIFNILFFSAILSACNNASLSKTNRVCFNQRCFAVEIADNAATQEQGLMFRPSLAKNSGMLFIFAESQPYSFWMKNTLIPLDMIWMDKNKKIVYIASHAMPCQHDPCPSYLPTQAASYVLEINAGLSEELRLTVGDQAQVNLETAPRKGSNP